MLFDELDARMRGFETAQDRAAPDCGALIARLDSMSMAEKRETLAGRGVDFGAEPEWKRLGAGLLWENYEKEGVNSVAGEAAFATRRRLTWREPVPAEPAIDALIPTLLEAA